MNHRTEPDANLCRPATIKIFGPAERLMHDIVITAETFDLSPLKFDNQEVERLEIDPAGNEYAGIGLRLSHPLPCGALVEMNSGLTIALGEIVHCEPADRNDIDLPEFLPYVARLEVSHYFASAEQLERFRYFMNRPSIPQSDPQS